MCFNSCCVCSSECWWHSPRGQHRPCIPHSRDLTSRRRREQSQWGLKPATSFFLSSASSLCSSYHLSLFSYWQSFLSSLHLHRYHWYSMQVKISKFVENASFNNKGIRPWRTWGWYSQWCCQRFPSHRIVSRDSDWCWRLDSTNLSSPTHTTSWCHRCQADQSLNTCQNSCGHTQQNPEINYD